MQRNNFIPGSPEAIRYEGLLKEARISLSKYKWPADLIEKLLENGEAGPDYLERPPVIKLFTPDAAATWLLVSVELDEPEIAYAVCDLGLGFVEAGSVSLKEIAEVRGKFGLPVERDEHFTPKKSALEYLREGSARGRLQA